jgi:isoquinoline 1-oxidoreductase beta subunit
MPLMLACLMNCADGGNLRFSCNTDSIVDIACLQVSYVTPVAVDYNGSALHLTGRGGLIICGKLAMSPSTPKPRSRRRFIIGTALIGGVLYVGYRFARKRDRLARPLTLQTREGEAALNGWLKIAPDGTVTVAVPRQDMGQGIYTALAMLVAEELDADWRQVRAEQAPVDPIYANITLLTDSLPFAADDRGTVAGIARWAGYHLGDTLGVQATGGSTSVRDAWEPMRVAGASARAMLIEAAAARWNTAPAECSAEEGFVLHASSGRRAHFGELASDAARLAAPQQPLLKDPSKYRLIGRSLPRLDVAEKARGSAQFGIDVRLPDMLYAAIAHCPVFGGRLQSFEVEKIRDMPGLKQVVALPSAVAVVAEHYWQAQSALSVLPTVWQHESEHKTSSESIYRQYEAVLSNGEAQTYRSDGDALAQFADAAQSVEAVYRVPLLAHATMEPINCTARVSDGACEVWLGNQAPSVVRWIAGKTAGVDSAHVTVHTPYLGGGFGRRAETDVVIEAVTIAKQCGGKPVQLIWSREEDIQHDVYRPAAMAKFRAALDVQKRPVALWNRTVGPSVSLSFMERMLPWAAADMMNDKTNAEGAADTPYEFTHLQVEHVLARTPVPVGFWRSVGHSYNAFFMESFIDELAHAAGRDPLQFRKALLAKHPRHRKVLETLERKASWASPPAAGAARGVALHASFRSIVGQVAEVSVSAAGAITVNRVICVIDCGRVIHPDSVIAQMEGSIVFGLSATLYGEITVDHGRVQQSNFHDYPLLRMPQTPVIETHILDSGAREPLGAANEAPVGGVGEPGVPPVAPAVANAVFAATGQRLRSLPLRLKA